MDFDTLSFSKTPPAAAAPQAFLDKAQTTSSVLNIPRNESFRNIGSIPLFASRPGTPNRSRSRANSGSESNHSPVTRHGGFGGRLHGFTKLEPAPPTKEKKADLDEVSRNLHAAMRERGRRRKSETDGEGEDGAVEFENEISETPISEGELDRGANGGKKDV